MNNKRNARTTHPKIRARREGALERLASKPDTYKPDGIQRRQAEKDALTRKLAQRKQGSAA